MRRVVHVLRIGILLAALALLPGVGATATAPTPAAAMPAVTIDDGGHATLSTGNVYACAIDATSGNLTCWGEKSKKAVSEAPTSGSFSYVSTGPTDACALTTDDALQCWGSSELILSPPTGSYTAISVGGLAACALTDTDTIACWGQDGLLLNPPPGQFTSISVSQNTACAIDKNGSVRCWGARNSIDGKSASVIASSTTDSFCVIQRDDDIQTEGTIACSGSTLKPPPGDRYVSLGVSQSTAVCAVRISDATDDEPSGELVCSDLTPDHKILDGQPGDSYEVVAGHGDGMCAMGGDGVPVCWGQDRRNQGLIPALTAECPDGQVGVPYSDLGPTSPPRYEGTTMVPWYDDFTTDTNLLPPGLELDPATGLFNGIPTEPGSYPVTVTASTSASPLAHATCTIEIEPGIAAGIRITPATATVDVGQSQTYAVHTVTDTGVPVEDVTEAAEVTISEGATCSGVTCSSEDPGTYTVTAHYPWSEGVWSDDAKLIVEAASPTSSTTPAIPTSGQPATPSALPGQPGSAPPTAHADGLARTGTGPAAAVVAALALAIGVTLLQARRRRHSER